MKLTRKVTVMKRRVISISVAVAALIALGGCETVKSVAGLQKQVPDEFEVVTRAPLSLPPDFGLRTPNPGAERPQDVRPRDQARNILLRNSPNSDQRKIREAVKSGRFSPGEAALLARAGAVNADPGIRQTINKESSALVEESDTVTRKILFWQKVEKPGMIVDPGKESQRIRQARSLGDPISKGNVPIIERKEKGWLEGIF
jgi:hypothetical protein